MKMIIYSKQKRGHMRHANTIKNDTRSESGRRFTNYCASNTSAKMLSHDSQTQRMHEWCKLRSYRNLAGALLLSVLTLWLFSFFRANTHASHTIIIEKRETHEFQIQISQFGNAQPKWCEGEGRGVRMRMWETTLWMAKYVHSWADRKPENNTTKCGWARLGVRLP